MTTAEGRAYLDANRKANRWTLGCGTLIVLALVVVPYLLVRKGESTPKGYDPRAEKVAAEYAAQARP